jgi:hypothetical protein
MLQAWTLILSCAASSLDFIIITAKARVELNLVQVLRQDIFFGFPIFQIEGICGIVINKIS